MISCAVQNSETPRHPAEGSSVSSWMVPVQSLGSMAFLSFSFCEVHGSALESDELPAGEYFGKLTILERRSPV